MSERIRIAAIFAPVLVLGPGRRLGIWVQGCRQRCPGCLAPEMQPEAGGALWPEAVLADHTIGLARSGTITGITISGGEPLLQWPALRQFCLTVREECPELDVIVYTGYMFTDGTFRKYSRSISETEEAIRVPTDWFDVVIDGPYMAALADEGKMRGSANQRILRFTGLGRRRLPGEDDNLPRDGRLQYCKSHDSVFIAGIPLPTDAARGTV